MAISIHHEIHFVDNTKVCVAAPDNDMAVVFQELLGILVPFYSVSGGVLKAIDRVDVIYSGSDSFVTETFEMSGTYPSGLTPTVERITVLTNKTPGEPAVAFPKVEADWSVTVSTFTVNIETADPGDGGDVDVYFNYTGKAPPAAIKVKIKRQTVAFQCN